MLKNTKFFVLGLLLSAASASYASEALEVIAGAPVVQPAAAPQDTAETKAQEGDSADDSGDKEKVQAPVEAKLVVEAAKESFFARFKRKVTTCPLPKCKKARFAALFGTVSVAAGVFAYVYSTKNAKTSQKPAAKK